MERWNQLGGGSAPGFRARVSCMVGCTRFWLSAERPLVFRALLCVGVACSILVSISSFAWHASFSFRFDIDLPILCWFVFSSILLLFFFSSFFFFSFLRARLFYNARMFGRCLSASHVRTIYSNAYCSLPRRNIYQYTVQSLTICPL